MSFLPNLLTLMRLILAPVVAWALWNAFNPPGLAANEPVLADSAEAGGWAIFAASLFTFAALTDLFDGWAARALDADSKLGRILDPIADKALVGLPLIVLAIVAWQNAATYWMILAISTAIIVIRDLVITLLRMTAKDGEGARVSYLAKLKTTAELLAVGLPIFLVAGPAIADRLGEEFSVAPWMLWSWMALLVLAAALSAITALGYLTGSSAGSKAAASS